ncbi:nucleotidyl transferase AbiEii/AbiGii toxin family protein [Chondrinema litorale]|uniref:nucleotidyl transferase AbiEii/AbiGii toxin family protein n=1 Tax=Chondrinema litorale TaxID=2994555 RepID=UPI002542858B|nr:nucleotidyl transferase AbiEii/AbiGii toxin family protein [Chondrinema litorale]UZS00218.1 nucleotidyl transferase AbiEii/AbiGii toxin family protein [Chondrinema litorale]
MIREDSLTEEWIKKVAKDHKADPILVEKVIRALYLLEKLCVSELDFIFKGGTALTLLLPEPKRFSIDIDIIISDNSVDIKIILDWIIKNSDFIGYKEDERENKSDIKKAHYKFYYEPASSYRSDKEYILLDILYQESHYEEHVQEVEITSNFLNCEGNNILVTVPTAEAILGDKLTAFAPNTTGIPYQNGKEVEIIKQLFDIGNLFDMINNAEIISDVFEKFAKTELDYRNLDLTSHEVLNDIIKTAMLIATRGQSGEKDDFTELQKGISNIKNYIFSESFHIEKAMIPAAKAAYLAALLLNHTKEIIFFTEASEIAKCSIEQPFHTKLNKLKKTNPEAFFYWCKTYELLHGNK